MVRELQVKFVKTAMTAITVLLFVVIFAIIGIYSFNIYTRSKETAQMLANRGGFPAFDQMEGKKRREDQQVLEDWDQWAEEEEWEDMPDAAPPGQEPEEGFMDEDFFHHKMTPDDMMSVRYFIVRFDAQGIIEAVDTASILSVTDDKAREYGTEVLQKGKESGITGGFLYFVKSDESTKTAAFVDVSSQITSILNVAVISVIIVAIAWVLMLVFVSALSRKAIAPIAENISRQKQFVTNAGHELKTPLAIIMANTEALELFNGETKWTRNIKAQTQRLSGLMQNLLTLSRMDEADLNLPMEEFDLGELAAEAAAPFEEPAREKKLSFSVQTPSIRVKANRSTIGQLVGILLDNAVKYTPEGGEILVTARTEGKTVILEQSNTIDPADVEEDPERLFDRFYRRDEARTQKKGGYGIGLSAARAIAQANHAQIDVRYNGQESIVFTVKLMI